ncbi:MAG TPA: hypothetical protein VH815_04870 [Acidobacteriota bacterium]
MAKTNRITQMHRVTVETGDKNIVFIAEPGEGRLVTREEDEDGKEVCSLKLANPDELSAFFEGLQRIFASTQNQHRIQQTEQPRPMQRSLPDASNEENREEVNRSLRLHRHCNDRRKLLKCV